LSVMLAVGKRGAARIPHKAVLGGCR
jgi:hypothetical protein